ncbi:MAG: MoaD/ThiS family protein [Oscillospiraceae bacterium]|jgi:molybdopterin converting factor small subunit|nr:MoaD/ThiS family protein [Oscillospiraceae bacterium]
MAVTLFIPAALRPFADNKAAVILPAKTAGEAVAALAAAYPDIQQHLYEPGGALRSFVNLFVGDTNIKNADGLNTPVPDGGEVTLVPAIAGGCL